jgi:hypothetical protein
MREQDDMLGALDAATTAVIAHGLLNSMAVLSGTATTMIDNWDRVAADPVQARQMLERIARHARLASGVLEDLVRGMPADVATAFASIDRPYS